ncbi:hypothetical protein Tco_1493812 [Tanacetum coccineum]
MLGHQLLVVPLYAFYQPLEWEDLDVCFKDCFLLSPLLASGFLPWGTSLGCEEGFGALETTCTSHLQMAFMWVVKGGSSGKKGFGLSGLSRVTGSSLGVISGDEVLCDDDYAIVDS